MAKKRKCKPDISNRCFARVNAKCVDYEGKVHNCSEYDDDDCINVEEAIEDLTEKVNDLCLGDFEGEGCIEYEAEDPDVGITLKDILTAHDKEICALKEGTVDDGGSEDEYEVDDCGNLIKKKSCCDILKHKVAYADGKVLVEWLSWDNIPGVDLSYKIQRDGTYKITVEAVYKGAGETMRILHEGISVNGNNPLPNLFESTVKKVALQIEFPFTTLYVIDNLKKDDVLDLKLKAVEKPDDPSYAVGVIPEYIKVIYEIVKYD